MFPIQLAGLALAGRTLLARYQDSPSSNRKNIPFPRFPMLPPRMGQPPMRAKPASTDPGKALQSMMKGMSSSISRIKEQLLGEDYDAVVKRFLPAGAKVIIPARGGKSEAVQFADLDGDSEEELITSYKQNDELKTMVLKKWRGNWNSVAEISHPGYDTIKYRNSTAITGEGKKQLLLGLVGKDKSSRLYGYSLDGNAIKELFSRDHQRFEVIEPRQGQKTPAKAHLALWRTGGLGEYNVELLHWNGSQLEPNGDTGRYYSRRVVPHLAGKVRMNPADPTQWYLFADALAKAGLQQDARTAVDVGMSVDQDGAYRERFTALKNKLQ